VPSENGLVQDQAAVQIVPECEMNPQVNEDGEGEKLSESKPHSQPVVPQESEEVNSDLLNQEENDQQLN